MSEADGLEPRGVGDQGNEKRGEEQRRMGQSKCSTADIQTGHVPMIRASFEFLYD